MDTIDWDQLALNAAERDLAGIVREIAPRYGQHRPQHINSTNGAADLRDVALPTTLDWRTLVAIADEAEADIGLQARHEPWVLARLLRLPGDEALRRGGELPSLDAAVDLQWPDAPAPAVFRATVAAFADDDLSASDAAPFTGASLLSSAASAASAASLSGAAGSAHPG